MNAPPGGGAPKPPPHLWAEMEAAGKTGDDYRLAIANAQYRAWLEDNGIYERAHGSETPPEAIR